MIGTAALPIPRKGMKKTSLRDIKLRSPKNSIFGLEQTMILGLGILYAKQSKYIHFLLPVKSVEKLCGIDTSILSILYIGRGNGK